MPAPRKRPNKVQTAAIVAGSLVVVAVVALVLANLADSGSGGKVTPKHVANSVGLALKLGKVNVQSAGPPPRVNTSVRQAVLDASQSYVDRALLAPLDKGKVDEAYAKIFDRGVRGPATGSDRGTLTEVRTGKLKGRVTATSTPVNLDAMGDQTGKLVLVAASFRVEINAAGSGGPVKITRGAELTFAPEGGRWLVTAYHVVVIHKKPASTTSAVVRAGSGAIA